MRSADGSPGRPQAADSSTRMFGIGLRAVSLAAKFALLFFMARYLAPADFGTYGLLAAAIGYATYVVGADYYTYANRELIRGDRNRRGGILKHQVAAYGATYSLAIPLALLPFAHGVLPWPLVGWFLTLLILEHAGQESMRILVALGRPVAGAVALFLRAGLWPLVVMLLLWRQPEFRQLPSVLACWAASAALGQAFAMMLIVRMRPGGWAVPIDWAWIRRGFRVAAWFLAGSLALRGLFTVDRFWIDQVATPETLAAYVFFISIAGALPALLEAGLFAFEYPAMVATYPGLDAAERRRHAARLLLQAGAFAAAYCIAVPLLLPVVLEIVGRTEYAGQGFFLVAGLVAMSLYVLSLVPHFGLYALGMDRAIVLGNILAFIAFFPITLALRQVLSADDAIPAALCASFLLLLIWKMLAFHRVAPPTRQVVI